MKYLLRILPLLALLASPAVAELKCEALAADSSCTRQWGGASGTLQIEGGANAFNGGPTVTLQWKTRSAAAFEQIEATACTFTAAGFCDFSKGRGELKIVVTGGTGADIVDAFVSDEHEAALTSGVSSSGVVAGNLTMADDSWIGLGAAAGRIEFDSTPSPDAITLQSADFILGFTTAQLRLPLSNDGGAPTLAFGDGDTGFYHPSNNLLNFAANGVFHSSFGGSWIIVGAGADNPGLLKEVSSATNPVIVAHQSEFPTGRGGIAGEISDIIGGVEGTRLGSDLLFSSFGNHGAFPPATCTLNGAPFLDTDDTDDTNVVTTINPTLVCCVATDTWSICGEPGTSQRAFGAMTFHGIATSTLTITTAAVMTKVTAFTVAKDSDPSGNVIVDVTDDDLEVALAGEYDIAYDLSLASAAGGSRDTIMAAGIELVTPLVITDVTNATPMVVTIAGHGLDDGDIAIIVGVDSPTNANGSWVINASDANTFEIYDLMGVAGVGNGAYTSGGTSPTIFDSLTIAHLEVANNTISTNSGGVIGGVHLLSVGDKASLWVANVDDTANYELSAVAMGMIRLGG